MGEKGLNDNLDGRLRDEAGDFVKNIIEGKDVRFNVCSENTIKKGPGI